MLKGESIEITVANGSKRAVVKERVTVVETFGAFFLIERPRHWGVPSYEAVAYRDITNGTAVSTEINNEIHRIETLRGRSSVHVPSQLD